jgi:uncharacterized membrane protein YvbJ
MRFCPSCGAAAEEDGAFCASCGRGLVVGQPRIAPAAVSPRAYQVSAGKRPKRRSLAWIYYAILCVLSIVAAILGSALALIGTVLFGAYSFYLYRGGRIVIWFW